MAQKIQFQDRLSSALLAAGTRSGDDTLHSGGGGHGHSHDHHGAGEGHIHDPATGEWTPVEHGHTHEHLENPGKSPGHARLQ